MTADALSFVYLATGLDLRRGGRARGCATGCRGNERYRDSGNHSHEYSRSAHPESDDVAHFVRLPKKYPGPITQLPDAGVTGNVSVATALPRIDERPRHERDSRLRRPGRRHGQCDRQSIQPAPGRGPDNAWQENQYDLGCPRTFSAMKDRISCSVTGAILGSIDSRNSRSTWNSCA